MKFEVFTFSTAACKEDSCDQGECVETINSQKCDCFKGFYGERCEYGEETFSFDTFFTRAT